MGFLICNTRPIEQNRIAIGCRQPLVLGGLRGLFAKNVATLALAPERWTFSAQALLRMAGLDTQAWQTILFDLTPRKTDRINLYELIDVSGRTASLVTDALFHFKVACSGANAEQVMGQDQELIVPDWTNSPDRYEQLRLEGGTKGGSWAWSEPPQSMSATIL